MTSRAAEVRSKTMRAVKAKGNRSTERRLRALLVRSGISGWRLGHRLRPGRPDFVFEEDRLAVFVDGCFWHGCACKSIPKARRAYWAPKIAGNRARDLKVTATLRARGWRVLRIWEHDLACGAEVIAAISKRRR